MRRVRRLTTVAIATVGVLAGGLLVSAVPALAAAPQVVSETAPYNITPHEARLEADVNAGEEPAKKTTECHFQYGLEGHVTEHEVVCEQGNKLEGGEQAVSVGVIGLQPKTPYEAKVVVKNATGKDEGTGEKFTTLTLEKPTVANANVPSVTPFEARIEATVNADYQSTTCVIQYGETTSYGREISCEPATLTEGEQGVGATVAGLKSATVYHYRILAKNATGEAEETGELTTLTAEAPIVVSESVKSATASDPQLEAVVNPNDQQTTYFFQYANSEEALINEEGVTVKGAPPATPLPAVFAELTAGPVGIGPVTPRPERYYYRVVATNATGTSDGPPQSFVAIEVPAVTTGEAQELTQTSAELSGTVTPLGLESSYQFEYVSEAGYQAALTEDSSNPYHAGALTYPTIGVGSSYEPQAVSPLKVEGLTPGTTYHYALVAQNNAGITVGHDATFTTQPATASTPPTVTTGPASNVSQNSATLSGTVSTNSLQTEYGFEIGTEPGNYGPATGLGSIGGAATEEVHVTLGELQPGTTYYYRITATNADGTVQGQPGAFTTPGFPTLLTAPSSPPLIAAPNIAFPKEEKTSGTTTKALTNKEKLANALKACEKDHSKSKRQSCERAAKKKYPATKKKRVTEKGKKR